MIYLDQTARGDLEDKWFTTIYNAPIGEHIKFKGGFKISETVNITKPIRIEGDSRYHGSLITASGFAGPIFNLSTALNSIAYPVVQMEHFAIIAGDGNITAGIVVAGGTLMADMLAFHEMNGTSIDVQSTAGHDVGVISRCEFKSNPTGVDKYQIRVDVNGYTLRDNHMSTSQGGGIMIDSNSVGCVLTGNKLGEFSQGNGMNLKGSKHTVTGNRFEGGAPYQLWNGSNFSTFGHNAYNSSGVKDLYAGGAFCTFTGEQFNGKNQVDIPGNNHRFFVCTNGVRNNTGGLTNIFTECKWDSIIA